MNKYRAAIIGCGRKGSTIDRERRWIVNYDVLPCSHASAYRAHPRVELIAGASKSEASLQDFQERWCVDRTYTDYHQMLEKEEPDIVSVATHAPVHAAATIAATQSKVKGIIVEKAMATSLEEAEAMLEACRNNGVKLLVNHPRRFHPTFQRVKHFLTAGRIGELQTIVITGYGKLIHNGSHAFDFIRHMAGEAEWICGDLVETDDTNDPDGRGMVKLQNGVTAFIDFTSGQPFEFILIGTEGRMVVDQFRDGVALISYEPDNPEAAGPWFRYHAKRSVVRHFYNEQPMHPPMLAAVEELIRAIEEGRDPVSCGQDGLRSLELGIALHLSARQNSIPVSLPVRDKAFSILSR